MAAKVLVNLATGLEDSEPVTVAFPVAGAALQRDRELAMFLTKWLGDEPGTVFSY